MYQVYLRHSLGKTQVYLRYISDTFQAYLGHISGISQTYLRHLYILTHKMFHSIYSYLTFITLMDTEIFAAYAGSCLFLHFSLIFSCFWPLFLAIHWKIRVILGLSEGRACCLGIAIPEGILAICLFSGKNILLPAGFRWYLGIFRNSQAVFIVIG